MLNRTASLTGLLTALALLFTAFAIGVILLRVGRLRIRRHPVDASLLAALLGLDLLSLAMLAIGQVALLPRPVLQALLMAGTLAAVAIVVVRRRELTALSVHLWGRRKRLLLFLPLLVLPLGKAMTAPIGWDELVYHLTVPAQWLADGKIAVYPDNPYSGLPSGVELLYTLAMGAGNLIAPGSLNYLVWLLTIATLYRVVRRFARPWSAGVLAVVFACSTVTLTLVYETYVELFLLLNVLGMLLVLRHYPAARQVRVPVLMGALLGGAACGIKLTGIMLPALLLPLLWHRRRHLSWRLAAGGAALFLAIVACYYARPYLAMGNPLHPYYARLFTPGDRLAVLVSEYHHHLTTARYGAKSLVEVVLSPLHLGWMRGRYDGALGWPWLLILAAAVVALARRPLLWRWGIGGMLCYLLWLASAQQARFVLPAVVVAYVLAAWTLHELPGRWRLAATILLLAVGLWDSRLGDPRLIRDQWAVLAGRSSMREYVAPWVGNDYLAAVDAVGLHTEPDARLLLLIEKRALYIERHVELGTPFMQGAYLTPPELHDDSPKELADYLRRERFDYLLVGLPLRDPDQLSWYNERMNGLMAVIGEAARGGQLEAVWQRQPYLLLRVPPEPASP